MQTCRHRGCQCDGVASYDGYCSTYCAQVDRRAPPAGESPRCGCGHPPCGDARP